MDKLLRYYGKDIQDINLNDWLELKSPTLRPIALKWLNTIQHCGADVKIIFHDGYPIGCLGDFPFAYVNAYTAHVNVGFFYGAYLPDNKSLLEGTGKHMRHIKLKPGLPLDEAAIDLMLGLAYADIQQRIIDNYP